MSYVRTSKYNKDQHTTQYKFGQIGVVALVYSEGELDGSTPVMSSATT